MYCHPKWKNAKFKILQISKFNDFFLEKLALINFRWQKLILNNKDRLSLQKYAVLERIVVYVSYYSEVLSEYAKKSGGSEKSEV